MGDRGTNKPNVTSRIRNILNETPFFCKIIELIVCVVAVGLIVDPFKNVGMQSNLDHAGIVYVSICGYILINAIIILSYLIGERQPKKMSIIFSVVGAIMCFASGIVLIYDWSNKRDNMLFHYHKQYLNQMVTSGIFALLASVIFLIDAFVTNKRG